MAAVISEDNKVVRSMKALQKMLISRAMNQGEREWAFPGGHRAYCPTFSLDTHMGEMLFAIPPHWDGRQAHLFKLGLQGGSLSPDAEINIADSFDRRISGTFVKTSEDIWLCHRGSFTAFRGRVPRHATLDFFRDWLQSVDDGDRKTSVITISSLKSGSIAEDIAEFVSKVKELKATFRAEGKLKDGLNASRSAWSNHDEYEGDKRYTPPEGPSTYTYLHGPLCNALKKRLNTIVENHPYYRVGNNLNVDVAIFDLRTEKAIAIFEVKTSASMSEQLYTAFGQLAFYKHAHGTPATKLYLVLPENERKNILAKNFFKDAAIELIFGAHDQFLTTGRKPLQSVISIT